MTIMYILRDGTETTANEITRAFAENRAVIRHWHMEGRTGTGLMLDGSDIDTRGECYSVWEETWTRQPESIDECLKAAYYNSASTGKAWNASNG